MLRIGVACEVREDYEFAPDDPSDANRDLVSRRYLGEILQSLEELGLLGHWIGDAHSLLKRRNSLSQECSFVFNLAEGVRSPNRASAVPLVLELLEIPFLGSDAYSHALSLNKYHVELIARDLGLTTPDSILIRQVAELAESSLPPFPLLAKPLREGSSIGITEASIASSLEQLVPVVKGLIEVYRQPVLVQRFISGYEWTIPFVGNDRTSFFQPLAVVMDEDAHLGNKIYSSDVKYLEDHRVDHLPLEPPGSLVALRDQCAKLFRALNLQDYARFDFRVDEENRWHLIDVNAMAYLGKDSSFARAFAAQGLSHNEMVAVLLRESFRRVGIQW